MMDGLFIIVEKKTNVNVERMLTLAPRGFASPNRGRKIAAQNLMNQKTAGAYADAARCFTRQTCQSFFRAASAISGQRLMMYWTALRPWGIIQSVQFLIPLSV